MSGNDETPIQSAGTVEITKTKEQVQEEATSLLTTGKRHLLVNDVPAAVTAMSQACELLSKMFGESAIECAEAYYLYGKALLELSRLESGVLGNALDGVPEEEDEGNDSKIEDPSKLTDEEKNEVDEKVREALKENFVDLENKVADKSEETKKANGFVEEAITKKEDEGKGSDDKKSIAEEEKKTEAKEVEPVAAKEGDGTKAKELDEGAADDGDMEEGGDSHDEGTESKDEMETDEVDDGDEKDKEASDKEDEEPSNLQLAWEMLEVAKVAYMKQIETGDADNKKKHEDMLCKSIMALGEVSIENENYCQAVEDMQQCLKKREAMPKDSRLIAETQYQLGVALGFNKQFDEAVTSLKSAIQILEERLKEIKNGENPSEVEKKEAEELEALIPEIEGKIADTEDMKKEADAKQKDEGTGFEVTASGKGDIEAVSSIAVKRKAEGADSLNKKVAVDEQTAGAS